MRRSTTTARTGATAPPCNPATQRIGRHLYSIGTTRESLERSVRARAEAIQQGAETDAKVDPEHAAHFAEHRLANAQGLATAALDIVDRSREAEPCRVDYIFTESEGPEPVPGQTLFRVPEWDWHVEVAQVLERKKGRDGSRVAEIPRGRAPREREESRTSATPTDVRVLGNMDVHVGPGNGSGSSSLDDDVRAVRGTRKAKRPQRRPPGSARRAAEPTLGGSSIIPQNP